MPKLKKQALENYKRSRHTEKVSLVFTSFLKLYTGSLRLSGASFLKKNNIFCFVNSGFRFIF